MCTGISVVVVFMTAMKPPTLGSCRHQSPSLTTRVFVGVVLFVLVRRPDSDSLEVNTRLRGTSRFSTVARTACQRQTYSSDALPNSDKCWRIDGGAPLRALLTSTYATPEGERVTG